MSPHARIDSHQAVFGKDPREYSVMTKEFLKDDKGHVKGLVTVSVEVTAQGIKPIPGSEKVSQCVSALNRLAWVADMIDMEVVVFGDCICTSGTASVLFPLRRPQKRSLLSHKCAQKLFPRSGPPTW